MMARWEMLLSPGTVSSALITDDLVTLNCIEFFAGRAALGQQSASRLCVACIYGQFETLKDFQKFRNGSRNLRAIRHENPGPERGISLGDPGGIAVTAADQLRPIGHAAVDEGGQIRRDGVGEVAGASEGGVVIFRGHLEDLATSGLPEGAGGREGLGRGPRIGGEDAGGALEKIGLGGVDAAAVGPRDGVGSDEAAPEDGFAGGCDRGFHAAGIGDDGVGREGIEHAHGEASHALDRGAEHDGAGSRDNVREIGAGGFGEAETAYALEGVFAARPSPDLDIRVSTVQGEAERTSYEAGAENGDRTKGMREAQGTRKILPE